MTDIEIIGAGELITAMDVAASRMLPMAKAVTESTAALLQQRWRSNVKADAPKHGRRYIYAITSETIPTLLGATVDVGPETDKAQGGMGPGFEYGSQNQPPHLDAKRAADSVEGPFLTQIEAMVAGIL